MTVRLVLGLLIIFGSLAVALRRIAFLVRLITSGQPAPGRLTDLPGRIKAQVIEVFGQKRLLKWSVPGVAHFFTFWAFVILFATIVEAVGALFDRDFAFPIIGHWRLLGFAEDLIGTLLLLSLLTFAIIRKRNSPAKVERASRFYGSHTTAAWVVLGMIALVAITLFGYRGPQINTGHYPFIDHPKWTFTSWLTAQALEPLGENANSFLETFFILAQVAVIFGFLVIVTYSKHLHIFVAPINVSAKRLPDALGPLPMTRS